MARPCCPDVELYYITRSVSLKPPLPECLKPVNLRGLNLMWLWLAAIDTSDAEVRLTYKAGKQFLLSKIHLT